MICLEFVEWMRTRIGLALLGWGLAAMPAGSWEREAVARELRNQREYERYVAVTQFMQRYGEMRADPVLPYYVWRSQWRGMTRMKKVAVMPQRQARDLAGVWNDVPDASSAEILTPRPKEEPTARTGRGGMRSIPPRTTGGMIA